MKKLLVLLTLIGTPLFSAECPKAAAASHFDKMETTAKAVFVEFKSLSKEQKKLVTEFIYYQILANARLYTILERSATINLNEAEQNQLDHYQQEHKQFAHDADLLKQQLNKLGLGKYVAELISSTLLNSDQVFAQKKLIGLILPDLNKHNISLVIQTGSHKGRKLFTFPHLHYLKP